MRKPKLPVNPSFWLEVIKDPKQVKDFQERGNDRQKRNLERTLQFVRWLKIQEEKEAKGEVKCITTQKSGFRRKKIM